LIINVKGIPHLFNFQTAKHIENRTYTRVGTPYCRSPEMIMGRGYTKSTDIWSLGVLLFEMTYGFLPFKIEPDDPPVEIYEKILKVKHGILSTKDKCLNDLLLGMLSPSETRFDFATIQRNLWFSSVNKAKLLKQRYSEAENILVKELKEKNSFKKVFKASRLMIVRNS